MKRTLSSAFAAASSGVQTATAVILVAALAACAGPKTTESFYALSDGAVVLSRPSTAPASVSAPGIVVSAVTIPELIDRPQIVTRDASNRVIVSEQNLWAESVKSGIARTLAARVGRTLGEAGQSVQVGAYPQTSIADPALRITVDVVRFDAVPNGEAVVDVVWSLRRPSDDAVQTGRAVASAPIAGSSYDAIVSGWNDAVASIDRDIAQAVLALGIAPPQPGTTSAAPTPSPAPSPSPSTSPRRIPRTKPQSGSSSR